MEWFLFIITCSIFLLLAFVSVMIWAIGEKLSTLDKKIDKRL